MKMMKKSFLMVVAMSLLSAVYIEAAQTNVPKKKGLSEKQQKMVAIGASMIPVALLGTVAAATAGNALYNYSKTGSVFNVSSPSLKATERVSADFGSGVKVEQPFMQ